MSGPKRLSHSAENSEGLGEEEEDGEETEDQPEEGDGEEQELGSPSMPLTRRLALVSGRLRELVAELHIPFLDSRLYQKCTSSKDEEALYKLCVVTKAAMEHRRRTKSLLQLIRRREVIVLCLLAVSEEYCNGEVSTVEFQRKAVRLLYTLQRLSLAVVQGVDRWREQLTRPYPFMYQGVNYLLKILADNHQLSMSSLNQVLPLRLYDYPLCSHLPSLSILRAEMAADGFVTYPLQPGKKGYFSALPAKSQAKLKRAEAYLKAEQAQQQKLFTELHSLAQQGMFLPILNTSAAVPGCLTGISLKSEKWSRRLQEALSHASGSLTLGQRSVSATPVESDLAES